LGSSCVYPKLAKQPIKENYLLKSSLEETNEPYAIAKIAGIKLCENYNKQYKTNYISLMPTNTFGPNDNYNLDSSHFVPALIRKIYEAKVKKNKYLILWGNGKSKREILHVDDLADAIIFFMKKNVKHNLINIGSNFEKTIEEYANILMKIANVDLKIKYIKKNYNGTPRKKLSLSLAKKYGWSSKIPLKLALKETYNDYSNLLRGKIK
jgi:GDP-L-fucose synthase